MKEPRPPREKISQSEVLDWLFEHHPALHAKSSLERDWVWLDYDLRGDSNKEIRESIKAFGFRFAKRGHTLPDGKIAMWAHSCEKPLPFRRLSKAGKSSHKSPEQGLTYSPQDWDAVRANALAMLAEA